MIKTTHLKIIDPKKATEASKGAHGSDHTCGVERFVEDCRALFEEQTGLAGEDRELEEDADKCIIPDLSEERALFQWANIDIGEEETYRLQKSIRRHAALSGASELRFWGKILCTKSDYWLLEGEIKEAEETQGVPREMEGRGQGSNKKVYWANDDLLGDWIQLPDVHPDQIIAARSIKHIMTGDLNSKLNTNPPFPGAERHFLRAQIARIAHACTLAPSGLYGDHEDPEAHPEPVI